MKVVVALTSRPLLMLCFRDAGTGVEVDVGVGAAAGVPGVGGAGLSLVSHPMWDLSRVCTGEWSGCSRWPDPPSPLCLRRCSMAGLPWKCLRRFCSLHRSVLLPRVLPYLSGVSVLCCFHAWWG